MSEHDWEDDRTMDELVRDAEIILARHQHAIRLGNDALRLLDECYERCDMDPDLAEKVGTLLLRVANMPPLPPAPRYRP